MRIIFLLISVFIPFLVFGQTANFEDDFEDQDISDWTGDNADFTFITENDNTLLKQDVPDAGTSYLSIPSANAEGFWEFFVRLDGFAPSDDNKAEIYLMSDQADLTGSLNGYMLQGGENLGGDVFRLFKITAGAKDGEILTGTTDISAGGDFRVKVTRDAAGNWTLEVGSGYTGVLNEEDTGTDNTYTTTAHFGFITVYSSTRSDKFAFDFKIDIPPIEVASISPINDTEVDVTFSRDIDFSTVQTSDFTLNPGNINPASFAQQGTDVARITFTNPIPSGQNELTITDIDDTAGETTLTDTTFSFIIFDEYQSGDIIINEFLKDPPTGTTEEYVELHNTTGRYLNLKDWQLGDDSNISTITSSDFAILPDSFAVITSDTAALSAIFGNGNYIQASFPALNNSGDQVRLFDDTGTLADSLEYTSDWGGVDVALERRDVSVSSIYQENWGDSPAANNGTPGFANQVDPDETAPEISNVVLQNNQTLLLVASERLESVSAETAGNYSLSQNPEAGITPPSLPTISSVEQIAGDTVQINLDSSLEEYDGTWTLSADNLTDLFSNSASDTFEFTFTNPFDLSSVSNPQDDQILLTFGLDVDFSSISLDDFSLNDSAPDPGVSLTQPASDQILLTLNSVLSSGEYEIAVQEIQSESGWTISSNTSAVFFIFDGYQSGDIVINEFMYNQPGGTAEFVELKNTSDRFLNLKDWQIGDNNSLTSISNTDLAILPDSFIVISTDTSALRSYFGAAYYQQASLPALNNTGTEQVRIYDENGATADSLEYTSSWGGNGVSLERRDPSVSAIYQENWGDSPADNNGTPGFTNQIQPDESAPEILQFERISNSELQLIFTERIQESSAENTSNFSLSADNISGLPGLQSATYSAPDTILLQYDSDFPSQPEGSTYELTVNNQADIFGNSSSSLSENFFVIEYGNADSGDVHITEFMYDPATGLTDFIELYNETEEAYNLQNWTYNDNSGNARSISNLEFTLLPGARIILAPDSTLLETFPGITLSAMGSRFANLNSTTPDNIVIRNQNGELIDSLTYEPSWGGNEVSLERRSIDFSATFRENWDDSPSANLATPGTENEISQDTSPPELSALNRISNQQLQLVFSERLQQAPAENSGNFTLTADNTTGLPGLQSATFSAPDTILLQYDAAFTSEPEGSTYELSVSGQTDVFNNTAGEITETFFVIEFGVADSGDVYITEFMYDPATDFTDFIELYNATDEAFNLQDWTYNDNGRNPRTFTDSEFIFPPDSRIVLAPDSTIFNSFPGISLIDMGSGFANLNSTTPDDIVIRSGTGILIDSLTYEPSWGGEEISLERRSLDFPPTLAENWGDSPSVNLATPGAENLIQPDNDPPQISDISVQNSQALRVIFTERVLQSGAENTDNYSLTQNPEAGADPPTIPQIASVTQQNDTTVSLTLDAELETYNGDWILTAQNISDVFNNSATDQLSFDFTNPFALVNVSSRNMDQVLLEFSTDVDLTTVQVNDFTIDGDPIDATTNIQQPETHQILLDFPENMNSGSFEITISGISSSDGWVIPAGSSFTFVVFNVFEIGDIVINEFMKGPPSGLSDYVELKNTTGKYLNLKDWQIGDNISLTDISSGDLVILPDSFLVVTPDTLALHNIFGNRSYIQISLPNLNSASADQVRLLDQNGNMADSLEYSPNWGGTDVALERRSITVPSTYQENWGESLGEDSGTPGFQNQVAPDNMAPAVSELLRPALNQVLLVFTERVQQTPAENIANYDLSADNLSNLPTLQSATYSAPDSLLLQFEANLSSQPEGTTYELTISGQRDIFENITPDTTASFFVIDYAIPDSGDIFINEFMYDPAAGFSEFIELYNPTANAYNLQNWTYNDNSGNRRSISNVEVSIPPESHVILAPDNSIAELFPDITIIEMGSRFSALNNSGDAIVIRNQNEVLLDSLTYSSDWGGNELSLERRSIDISAIFRENWGVSPSVEFATPGAPNAIEADTAAPSISSVDLTGSATIRILFNERVEENSAEIPGNYSLSTSSSGLTLPTLQSAEYLAPDTVLLNYDAPFQREPEGTNYTLNIRNQADIFGNISAEVAFDFFLINYAESDSGEVFITEFMYDPPEGYSEFIELYNPTDSTYNLQNWTYNDNTGNRRVISDAEFSLNPGSHLILTPDSTIHRNFSNIEFLAIGSRFSALNNSDDAIVIRNEEGELIDSLTYFSSWGGSEVSLERRTNDISAVYRENWGDSPAEALATPSKANLIAPDENPPEIREVSVLESDVLQVLYSERIQSSPALNPANYALTSASSELDIPDLDSLSFYAPDTLRLYYSRDFPFETEGSNYTLIVSNQTDIFENVADELFGTFNIIKFSNPEPGAVAINEFMYDPPEGYAEFIELVNTTDSTLNLVDWTYNDNTGNRRVISDFDLALSPDEFLVLTPDSTLHEQFPEAMFIPMGTRFSSLNNSTDAIVIRDSAGVLIDSLTYSSNWGGDNVSLERRSTDLSAIYKENWDDSPAATFATPGSDNQILPDETPPEIRELNVINDSTLQAIFSERLLSGPATNESNFTLIVPGNISETPPDLESLELIAPDTILFYYPRSLPRNSEGSYYSLVAENQSDIFGNVASRLEQEFFLIDISMAEPGEVVINEFMYDPGENYSEFIELYNNTDQNYNLKDWTLNDNTGNRRAITSSNYELKVRSYVVLTPDSTLALLYPEMPIIVLGSSFSSLNNGSDAIVIRNQSGTQIDSLTYFSDWGGDGVSLERRDPDIEAIYAENWGDSPSEELATPGFENAIAPDNEPPEIQNAFISAPDTIRVIFNEQILEEVATNRQNISISPVVPIAEIEYQSDTLTLALDQQLTDAQSYTIILQNMEDIFGNIRDQLSVEMEFIRLSSAEPGDVIVNEILYRRASAESEEFIELFNRSDHNFDLSNWTFSDATSSTNIPDGTRIRSGGYLVLTDKQSDQLAKAGRVRIKAAQQNQVNDEVERVYIPGFPSLNDDEDAVVIKNQQGIIIDSLFYKETWGGNDPGVSLERKDPLSASNDASNWASSTSETGNSAGSSSTVYLPDEIPPEIIFARLQNDGKIFVAFSEFIRINQTEVMVNKEPVTITGYFENDANKIILGENPFQTNDPLQVKFSQVQDFRGNISRDLSVEVSLPLTKRSVIINEILYDPLANTDDNLPDQTEFIELYNRSEYAISLEGLFLHDEPDENDNIRTIFPVDSRFKWIPPGGYVLFYAENEATSFSDSKLANYFEMEEADDQFFIRTNRSSLSLASSDDAIYLADSTGMVIDSVFYDESWQNPNLYDTKGVSLERIDPDGPSNDESNWSSSTQVSGATPGEENTIFQQAGAGPENAGISFSPNPFSPDDDGFDDNLFINYKLDEPDYLLRVRIFDRYGRLVRELADGKQAGFEGSLIWDGNMDNNSRNRVGIYIVLFEAYNSANGKNRTFKETVVIARKF